MAPGVSRSEVFNFDVVLTTDQGGTCENALSPEASAIAIESYEDYLAVSLGVMEDAVTINAIQVSADDGSDSLLMSVAVTSANATSVADVNAAVSALTDGYGAQQAKLFFDENLCEGSTACGDGSGCEYNAAIGKLVVTYVLNSAPPSPVPPTPPPPPASPPPSPFVLSASKYCQPIDGAYGEVYIDSLEDKTVDECAADCLADDECAGYFYGQGGPPQSNLGAKLKLRNTLAVCVLLSSNCLCPQHEATYTGLLLADEGYQVAYKRESEEVGCLAPEFTQVSYGCTADAILMFDAATVIAAGTCDESALRANYNTSEQSWAAGEVATAAATGLWFPDASRCGDLCAANPCCVLYTAEQATDCYLYDSTCLGDNQDPQGGVRTGSAPNGTFLAESRTPVYKGAEEEAEEVNALVATGNAEGIGEQPDTTFEVCQELSSSKDNQLDDEELSSAAGDILAQARAGDSSRRQLDEAVVGDVVFKGATLSLFEVRRFIMKAKGIVGSDTSGETLVPSEFEQLLSSEEGTNLVRLAAFALPPPPPCANTTFPEEIESPPGAPPSPAAPRCETTPTPLSEPTRCGTWSEAEGGRNPTAERLERIKSVASFDACKAHCCVTGTCMSFTFTTSGDNKGFCDLYSFQVTLLAGFEADAGDDPQYLSSSRMSKQPPSPPTPPPTCGSFPKWAIGREDLREAGMGWEYCYQVPISACHEYYYFTDSGVPGQLAKCRFKKDEVSGKEYCRAKTKQKWTATNLCPPSPAAPQPLAPPTPPTTPPPPTPPPPMPLLPGGGCYKSTLEMGADWCYELKGVSDCSLFFTSYNDAFQAVPVEDATRFGHCVGNLDGSCRGGKAVATSPTPLCIEPSPPPSPSPPLPSSPSPPSPPPMPSPSPPPPTPDPLCLGPPWWAAGRTNLRTELAFEYCYDVNGYSCGNYYYATNEYYFKCRDKPGKPGVCEAKVDASNWPYVCGTPLPEHQVDERRRGLYEDAPPPASPKTLNAALSAVASVLMFFVGLLGARRYREDAEGL